MRLIGIRLQNFLAYHKPVELMLDTVDIACLSGPNGAGKSSLLDAVTWALWGKARTNDDDALIHSGQDEMTVTVHFDHDGIRYEVIRKHTRGGKAKSLSFFRYINGLTSDPEALGSGLRATQNIIDQLLRLNYETFVNSAFLRQGEADLFTTAKPAERKQVLAKILDLKRWEDYEKVAKERAKDLDKELTRVKDTITRLAAELRQAPDLLIALEIAEADFDRTQLERDAAENAYHAARGAKAQAEQMVALRFDLTNRLNRDQLRRTKLEQTYHKQNDQIDQATRLIARQTEIEAGIVALGEAHAHKSTLDQARLQYIQVSGQLDTARARLERDIAAVDREAGKLQKQIETAQKTSSTADDLAQQLAKLSEVRRTRDQYHGQLTALQQDTATLAERNKTLYDQMEVLSKRRTMLMSPTEMAICPVCAQPLDTEHRDWLNEQYTREGTTFGNEFRANKDQLKAIGEETKTVEGVLITCETQLAREPDLFKRHGQAQAQADQLQTWQDELDQRIFERDAVRNQLATDDYGHAERAQLDALGYDPAQHQAVAAQIAELSTYETDQRALTQALRDWPELEQAQTETIREATELQTTIAADEQQIDNLKTAIAAMADQLAQEQAAEITLKVARQTAQTAQEKQIGLQQTIRALEDVRRRLNEAQAQAATQKEDFDTLKTLAEAFGKNGVPALIIDAAIPEIEQEANKLLSKLTDGRLTVRLDTQKATKGGEMADTLNLQVSDESDTRDYALYSGGEGFRIDFAVRIALSMLLTRRANAKLQTLFIDEGFGSQDANGRERLIEAINAIRDRFELILVVTHIDELRDAFSTHVQVTKEADGSVVELIQN